MPKMICICILLIYFKVISKKGVTIAPAYPISPRLTINIKLKHIVFSVGLGT